MTQVQRALLIFVVVPSLYTICFFAWCYAERLSVFSKRNRRSTAAVIRGHAMVLMILVLLTEIAMGSYPSLPDWMTEKTILGRWEDTIRFFSVCAPLSFC